VTVGFHFGTVYVRRRSMPDVLRALAELMDESEHERLDERGLDPTPDEVTSEKTVRSFAVLPTHGDWITVLEDGHSFDDGGVAEGLSDLLQSETLHIAYSDRDAHWHYEQFLDGHALEAGGADDLDYDVTALDFVDHNELPHFGVYYEEVAAAAGPDAPALAGSLEVIGDIHPTVPIGTEIRTFRRPLIALPAD
jgi:hypothetical protein